MTNTTEMIETKDGRNLCPKCGHTVIGREYHGMDPNHYDGISEWFCAMSALDQPSCDWRVGRWCGKLLSNGEVEPRYCDGRKAHPKLSTSQ